MTRLFDITAGQDHETKLALQNVGVGLEDYLRIKNDPEVAAKVAAVLQMVSPAYPVRDFSRYSSYLLSLDDQLQRLTELNKKLPKRLRVAASWLDLDTDTDHLQSVEDLEFFFIVLDTLEKTVAVNWELMKLTQPATYHSGFVTDADNLRLGPNTRWYEPGIHRVRVNLVDNWDPEKGRSIDQVRARVVGTDTLLASVEPIGAYALQSELFQQQDGENLPYTDLGGLWQGVGGSRVPYLVWYRGGRGAYLDSWRSGSVSRGCAVPSLQGVQS